MREAVRARLRAEIPGVPVDWNLSHPAAAEPRVVLWKIGGGDDYDLDGATGYSRSRVQIDCHGPSYGAAVALGQQVRAALSGWRSGVIRGAFLVDERDLTTDAGHGSVVAGISIDFIIHHEE